MKVQRDRLTISDVKRTPSAEVSGPLVRVPGSTTDIACSESDVLRLRDQFCRRMSALSQATRFDTFRRLVEVLPDGLAAGDIAAGLATAPNTMSAHLAILSRAGLVTSEKLGRTVVYRARTAQMEELVTFLEQSCA